MEALMNYDKLHNDVDALARLEEGWDPQSFGSLPMHENALALARKVGRLLDPALPNPQVVPMSNGRLQFEWNTRVRSFELEFGRDQFLTYLVWSEDEVFWSESFCHWNNPTLINQMVRSVFIAS
jgi:hypothetical protein